MVVFVAAVVVVVVIVIVGHGRRRTVYDRALLGLVVPVSFMVMVVMVMVMVPLVTAAGHRGQQAPMTPDPGPVTPSRSALYAYVHANRSEWFRPGSGSTIVAL